MKTAITNYYLLPMELALNAMARGYVPLVVVQVQVRHDLYQSFNAPAVAQHTVHLIPGKVRRGYSGGTAALRRARFQAAFVAWSWFRQNGVVLSRPPVPRRGITPAVGRLKVYESIVTKNNHEFVEKK